MVKLIKKVIDFITHGIWEAKDFKNRKSLWLIKQVRVIIYTVRGVGRHGSVIRSAALTFYTLMSLVPIAALAFGVIKAFGLDDQLNAYLTDTFPRYAEIVGSVIGFADSVLQRTRGGVVAITGLVILVWAAVRVFANVESAFNSIWEVKKKRNIARKASAYAIVIFVMPLLLVSISGVFSYVRDTIRQFDSISGSIFYTLGSVALIWMIFTLIYKVVPNTKVLFRHAAKAGAVATVAFMIFQWIYVYIQNGVSGFNVIYGSFASVPLFLLWVQVSWQILLYGGELSFSFQNIDSYIQEHDAGDISYRSRRKITLAAMTAVVESFLRQEGGINSERLSKELNLPVRLIRDVLYDLENAGLIASVRSDESDKVNMYIPARDIGTITVYGVLQAVEETGPDVDGLSDSRELKRVAKIIGDMERLVSESGLNMPITELISHESGNSGKRKRS